MQVETKVLNKEIEIALAGGLKELWNVISTLEGDRELEEKIDKIRWGVNVRFDIRSIVEGEYQMEVAFGRIRIERKKLVDITAYRDEIDIRRRMMKDILRDLYDESFDDQDEEDIEGYGRKRNK